jgi:FAD/FMN-containing dehydrogenase
MWPGDAAYDVSKLYRDVAYRAPVELGSGLILVTGPSEDFVPEHMRGTTVALIALLWAGDLEDGEDAIKAFRDLTPEVNLVESMPYADFQCMIDDPPGLYNYASADYFDDFGDEALEVFVEYGFERKAPHSQQILLPWGGAVAAVAEDATPMAQRRSRWVTHPFALWENAADTEDNIAWARGFRRDVAPYTNGGVYLNFIGNEGPDRVRAAFGDEKYRRLANVKAEWDPHNTFQGNQNIVPTNERGNHEPDH